MSVIKACVLDTPWGNGNVPQRSVLVSSPRNHPVCFPDSRSHLGALGRAGIERIRAQDVDILSFVVILVRCAWVFVLSRSASSVTRESALLVFSLVVHGGHWCTLRNQRNERSRVSLRARWRQECSHCCRRSELCFLCFSLLRFP